MFGEHDVYFTVGMLIGSAGCRVPTLGLDWHAYRNPVVLDLWSGADLPGRGRFGTVAALGDYGWLEFDDRILGPKLEELRGFAALPEVVGEPIDLVCELEPGDPDRDELTSRGWLIREPGAVAEPETFRDFVFASAGEFSVAKGGYVGTRCGWFSDRSACFLAAGRPVILQATGFEDVLPTGCGLFAVRDLDEAAAAIRAIRAEPKRHAEAARRDCPGAFRLRPRVGARARSRGCERKRVSDNATRRTKSRVGYRAWTLGFGATARPSEGTAP